MDHTTDDQQTTQCIELFISALGDDLLGIYLYGSSVMGGLQRYSDLDFFVVSGRATTPQTKETLSKALLHISGTYRSREKRSIDVLIVEKSEINPWQYPPKFDYHYGDWMRKDFESGNFEPWKTTTMPSIALLITQVLLSSKTLLGSAPEQILPPVPYADFIAATIKEMDTLKEDIETDERNVLLTFARIWLTVETDTIGSKQQAATWAIQRLPDAYKPLMQRAFNSTVGTEPDEWHEMKPLLELCVDFMIQEIDKVVRERMKTDISDRTIKHSIV